MADCGVSQVGCDVGKWLVTEWLWPRIKCHFDYWWCFRDNVRGLTDEIGFLVREKRNMDQNIEEARLHVESSTIEVEIWSEDSTKKLEDAARILQGCEDLKAWNIISRYSWGKRAKKTAEGIVKLRNEGNSIRISNPAPPPAMTLISHKPAMEFESRRSIEEDIMKFLTDDLICMVAICGAGGIGKTTMARRIEDRVRKEKLFDEVVHVVVRQQIDMLKIQMEIAELLGLNFSENTLAGRAHKLHIRLLDAKRKLMVFDDVWKYFKLDDIGVPFGNGFTRCKIILTSRVKDTCNKMGAQEIIPMEVLTEEEAWTLFKEKAGSCVEGPDLRPIAENVAAECKGLPVALVTIGVSLKDRSIHVWRDSLSQLRRSMPIDFPEVLEDVYKPLKLSYDFLEYESVKSLFLLCCLFPEDYNIRIEHLTWYGIGLDMFEGIRNIEEGRSRTHNFIEKLKSRFLLLDGGWRQRVKMHDVVRDVAIYIGSKEKHAFLESLDASSMNSSSKYLTHNCNWMSIDISIEKAKFLVWSYFPNLCLLMIRDSTFHDGNIICFEGMDGLYVLSLSDLNLRSLPPTLGLLKKLRTLHLHHCAVNDISVLGELASLEILCIYACHFVEELPANIGRLNCLILLELNECQRLKRIVAGVISSLVGLEELKIIYCTGIKWETKGNESEDRNGGFVELESLPNLTSLEIYISDCNLFAQEIRLSQKLVRYNINHVPQYLSDERKIRLYLPGDIRVGNWIRQLVRSTQSLELQGDGSNNFNLAEIESLRNLVVKNCSTLKKLVNATDGKFPVLVNLKLIQLTELEEIIDGTILEGSNSFQKLESLHVHDMPKLAHLWKCLNQNVSLGNLKSISIKRCPNLCYIFSVSQSRSLVQLQCLEIQDCHKIEQVFQSEIESTTNASDIVFPKLQELKLFNLPNLAAFSQGVEIIESLHQLTQLTIINCPKLRTKIGKCPNLKFVIFSNSNGPHHLLCSCHTIQYLVIRDCDTIKEILWDEIKDNGERHIIFPELKELRLSNLPCLTTFCRGVESIKFPKLIRMEIGNLPRMNSLLPLDLEPTHDDHSLPFFCYPKVETPGLENLYLLKLHDIISKIWCHHIPINFYDNIQSLYIKDVNHISNLISSSIAKNLVNLKNLHIDRCQEIVDVVEDEKEALITSPFSKLKSLFLQRLHKLRSFCQWKHAFELSSLEEVEIYDCPEMETFSLGLLSTPNLSKLKINYRRVDQIKDLNGGIHDQYFRTKIEDEDVDMYRDEDEDLYGDDDENEDLHGDEYEDEDLHGDRDEDFYEDEEYENSFEDKKEAEGEEDVESSKRKFRLKRRPNKKIRLS